jgi:lipoyl synthase
MQDTIPQPAGRPLRKPAWLKVRLPGTAEAMQVQAVISHYQLHSICREARCPNIAECFQDGTATFLILGNICTRNCLYCNVLHDTPQQVDYSEAERLVAAVKELALRYIVITSVTRDDLADGGASLFADCVERLRSHVQDCRVEVLVPDFLGDKAALERVMASGPDVFNHNLEVVHSLFKSLRPQGDYRRSLEVLRRAKVCGRMVIKSGFMIGFGESDGDIENLLSDVLETGCDHVTIGQYQQPTHRHYPVAKYYHPDEFASLKETAKNMGFRYVEAGPLVRSSYHAARAAQYVSGSSFSGD